jgi:DNA polymerase
VNRPVDTLLDFLRAEEARGVTHVHLDDAAKEVLRELHRRSRGVKAPAPAAAPARSAAPLPSVTAAPVAPAAPAAPVALPVPVAGSAAQRIAELAAQAARWAPARQLGTLRDIMVFSAGDPEAGLMLVGEAPGYLEEQQGQPFAGTAGQKLDDILRAMGLAREQVYISNLVKFRPASPGQTTNNRKLSPEEMACFLPFLRAEAGIVQPRCIVALGATAAEGLLGLGGTVDGMRGRWHEFAGIPVRVTYHPAYLLHRSSGNADKRRVWEDMLEVMEKLGLPISDKQRGYFAKP